MSQTIHLLIASTREARIGEPIAHWVRNQISTNFDADVKIIDLHTTALPFFTSPTPPSRGADTTPHGTAWAKTVSEMERLVIVTPEYNRGVPAALKNALDYLWEEWHGLPVAVVSYGYVDGGGKAAAHLKDTLAWLKTAHIQDGLQIQLTTDMLDKTGSLKDIQAALSKDEPQLKKLITQLISTPKAR